MSGGGGAGLLIEQVEDAAALLGADGLDLGELGVHGAERFGDDAGDDKAHVGLVVGGDGEPGRPGAGGGVEGTLVGIEVGVPVLTVAHVGHGELPLLLASLDARSEPLRLLFSGDVEPELEDRGAVAGEVGFVVADGGEPSFPEVIEVLDCAGAGA